MAEIVESATKSRTGRGVAAENMYRQARQLLGKAATGSERPQQRVRQGVRHRIDYGGEAGVEARQGQRAGGKRLDGDEPDRLWEYGRGQRDVRGGKEATKLALS